MSREVKIGKISIGNGNKIAIQSMTTFKPKDVENTIRQIVELEKAGCDIVRFAVQDEEDAKAIKKIKEKVSVPLVADIHFDYRLAVKSIENGIDKIRINPGNIGSDDKIEIVADCLKAHNVPVRVGSNTGSIEKEFLSKYGKNEISLGESALKNVRILEKKGVKDIVISVKASNVPLTVKAYKYVAERSDCPLHLGVTEAGTKVSGIVKSSIGIGSLLLDGIGDTIRVSLSDKPIEEVITAKRILRGLEQDKNYVEVVSCPTCGRCEWNCTIFAEQVENYTKDIEKPFKIAVMGCVVNGPGEAKDADLGIAGGKDSLVMFKKGEVYKKVAKEEVQSVFFKEIDKCLK